MKRRWKKFLAGVLSAALALNLAAPLALADSGDCTVAGRVLSGDVDSVTGKYIQGKVSYLSNTLTFDGDVKLDTRSSSSSVPLIKASNSNTTLTVAANGTVEGWTKSSGFNEPKEITGGTYIFHNTDWNNTSKGILGGDTEKTIVSDTNITLDGFQTGIGWGSVQINSKGMVTIKKATYGIANFTTMNPGSELEIHADRYIGKDCLLTYNGGHLLMIAAENADGKNIVQGRLSIGNVSRFWYRTDENGAYTEINVKENFENFTAAIAQNQDYLELTDVDPNPNPNPDPTNHVAYWVVRPGDTPAPSMQIPSAIFGSEEEKRLFVGWFLEDGTRLEDSPYYMGPDADYVGNLDRDVTFYGHWRTAESAEGSEGGSDGFGTLLAGGAVVGVAGVVAYQVGTELILDQLLPAGVAVPHTRAELAMLLWNTAGRPAPATLPAFADVADPELAQAAQWAIEQGYLKARADGSFKPDKGVAKWRVIRGYRAVTEP